MSNWNQISNGGKGSKRRKGSNDKAYSDNYASIFGTWPCQECGNKQIQGHKLDCSKHLNNK